MIRIFLFTILFSCTIVGQNIKKQVNIVSPKMPDIFQIINEKDNEFLFFFSKKGNISAVKFNELFELKDSMSYFLPNKKSLNVEGYAIKDKKYYVYWIDQNNKEMLINKVDFSDKKIENKNISRQVIEGTIISRLTINGSYYIISLIKNTNLLNLYKFDGFEMSKTNLDFSNFRLIDEKSKVNNLWQMFNYSTAYESAFSIQTISQETPPSLPFSANKRKLYVAENAIIFTFDINNGFTQTFKISLDNFEINHQVYNKPFFIENEFTNVDSNSFIYEDNILILKTTKEKLVIDIRHLNNDLIKTLEAYNNQDIQFQNSDIIQEKHNVKNRRVLGKTNQFLRKTSNLNPALSCYGVDDKIYMTLGGVSEVQADAGAAFIGGFMFGFVGGMIFSAILTSNYSNNNISSYYQRNIVYINSIFDRSFNHINEPIRKLPFDVLRDYVDGFQTDFSTVFKFKNNLYFCKYDNNNLTFYEFKN
jgi:hypothetical protein